MNSWVYIFSQFTPEALLFEALIIFLLCGSYAAFWVLRKRRYGAIDAELPSGPVKTYLNELILNAEQLRLQLFGLLNANSQPHPSLDALGLNSDPDLAKKMAALEAKMNQQLKALEALNADKARLEKELADARSSASQKGEPSSPGENEEVKKLQNKIQELEGRLFEYSVIEDDLANLKRLQQENQVLKSTLTGKGLAIPSGAASSSGNAANTPVSSPPEAAAPPQDTPPPEDPPAASPPLAAEEPEAAEAATGATEDQFSGLTQPVEESLQTSESPSPESKEPAPEAAASPTPPTTGGNDDDLVSEFEKMLKG